MLEEGNEKRYSGIITARRMNFIPNTKWGRWSLGLMVVMPILFVVGASFASLLYPSVPGGNTIVEDIAGRPALVFVAIGGMLCGVAAFIAGLAAVIKQRDRSLLVYTATAVGALFTLFLLGEFILPH